MREGGEEERALQLVAAVRIHLTFNLAPPGKRSKQINLLLCLTLTFFILIIDNTSLRFIIYF